jgi:diguanylate cyclase (GGDEF)-like protein/PAS domain S-box-containing protein
MVGGNTGSEGSLGLTAYRVLFERAPEGMILSTLDGQVHAANPAACRMLAMTETEIRRLGRAALVDNPDDPELEIWLAERDRTGVGTGETRLCRPDGRIVDVSVQSRLFADTDGTVMSFSVFRDVTARTETARAIEELSARVERVALTDALTGLANRRGLIVAGTELCARADRERAPVEVLYINAHNMAELNARVGRQAGDTALVALARALSGAFEPDDVLARIAGTGFLVLAYALDSATRPQVVRRLETLLDQPDALSPVGARAALSFGWVTRPPGSETSLEDLIARADRNMLEGRSATWTGRATPAT